MLADNDVIKMAVEIFWGFKTKQFPSNLNDLKSASNDGHLRYKCRLTLNKLMETKIKQ